MTTQPEPAPTVSLTSGSEYAQLEDLTGLTANYIRLCESGELTWWPGLEARVETARHIIARAHNPHKVGVVATYLP